LLAILVCTLAGARAVAAASLTPLGIDSIANSISGDGSVVVGTAGLQAFRWTAAGGMVGLGTPPGDFYSYARAVNADGSIVVGGSDRFDESSETYVFQAARWTAASGMQGLGHLPGGGLSSVALGVSDNGSVIVGARAAATASYRLRGPGSLKRVETSLSIPHTRDKPQFGKHGVDVDMLRPASRCRNFDG
jgi:uncharacterized membrane protein